MTAKDMIIKRLAEAPRPLALHELNVTGVSQTAASARLRELKRDGVVISLPIPGARYTAWQLAGKDMELFNRV